MVSFWPFKSSEDAASFEKTLSALHTKIGKASANNDVLRQRARRVRVMWTLYSGFAYILAALLLFFVTGPKRWGATEISAIAGGPVVIYFVRAAFSRYYDYRIKNTQTYLESLQKERDTTIERLKTATKYNSTQQLLEKYGSLPKKKESPSTPKKPQGPQKPAQPPGSQMSLPPPPTANIPRPGYQQPPIPQGQGPPRLHTGPVPPPVPASPGAEFAPNAFGPPGLTKQYEPAFVNESHWYDRILDALLGEDETQPKNRLALICRECRLVNGQASPGVQALEDVGRWRCGGCGVWNGQEKVKEDTVAGLVQGWEDERKAREKEMSQVSDGSVDSDDHAIEHNTGVTAITDKDLDPDVLEEPTKETPPPSKSTRSKTKSKGKR